MDPVGNRTKAGIVERQETIRGEELVRGAAASFGLPFEGLRLLLRERSLWGLALVPLALSALAVGLGVALLVSYAGALYAFASGWLPDLEVSAWYQWLWIGPAILALRGVAIAAFLFLCGVGLVLAYLVASLLAAPFHDLLAQRVEALASGHVTDLAEPGFLGVVLGGGRALRGEALRTLFFLGVQGAIVLAGLLIPGGQVLVPPAMMLFAIVFLPLDYASYTLDRRMLTFRQKREWVLGNKPIMLGFGSAAFALCMVPFLNLAAMPVLVVAGTLLVLRNPPTATAPVSRTATLP